MSETEKVVVKALVTGGKASGGPPIGPAVGPTGINIKDVVDAVNEKTMMFKGLSVPVRIECDPETKQFEIFVETPSTASLLMKEIGAQQGSSFCSEEKIGDISIEQIKSVVEAKKDSFLDKTYKKAMRSVLGTALSIGATVEGEDPRVIQKRITNGEYDDKITEEL
ncbi:MAG: 50S ribosomal protein L11 [Candidatus Lokiarchaeota archaeon]|nr:50S ribosomal protein L11 [Candidatus Lokiarchaeota archaeon]MBD3200691.1 50S ribosomal protein L11 [Candidatus Lokiarchaeota archaeon]